MTYTITGFEFGLLRLSGLLVPLAIAPWAVALIGVPAGWWEPEGRWAVYLICTALAVLGARRWTLAVRECFVREAALPQLLKHRLRDAYPLLSAKDADLAERGLRQFFIACLRSNKNFVAVPSHAVGALWSAFSQDSKAYRNWCQNALGYAPDYSPAQVLGKKASNNDALRRAWYWACKDEAINPRTPSRAATHSPLSRSALAPVFRTAVIPAAFRILVAPSARAARPVTNMGMMAVRVIPAMLKRTATINLSKFIAAKAVFTSAAPYFLCKNGGSP